MNNLRSSMNSGSRLE